MRKRPSRTTGGRASSGGSAASLADGNAGRAPVRVDRPASASTTSSIRWRSVMPASDALDRRAAHREHRRRPPRRHAADCFTVTLCERSARPRIVSEIAQVGDEAEATRRERSPRARKEPAAARHQTADAPRLAPPPSPSAGSVAGGVTSGRSRSTQVDVSAASVQGEKPKTTRLAARIALAVRGPHANATQRELADAVEARRADLEAQRRAAAAPPARGAARAGARARAGAPAPRYRGP